MAPIQINIKLFETRTELEQYLISTGVSDKVRTDTPDFAENYIKIKKDQQYEIDCALRSATSKNATLYYINVEGTRV